MKYVFASGALALWTAMIGVSIWSVKKQCKDSLLHAQAVYLLYKELKRFNDKTFGTEDAECDQ